MIPGQGKRLFSMVSRSALVRIQIPILVVPAVWGPPGVKQLEHAIDYCPPSCAEVKND